MANNKNYSEALERLKFLLSKVNRNADVFTSKDLVLKRFQPIFSHSHVVSLKQSELEEFLHERNNHHWTMLDRQTKNLVSEMDKLRQTLFNMTDQTIPLDQRIGRTPHVKGLRLGILTPMLMMFNEKEYGVWNSKTDKFFTDFNLLQNRSMTNGQLYQEVNSLLHKFALDLKIGLWELDALFHYHIFFPDIFNEIDRRKKIFDSLNRDSQGNVDNNDIRNQQIRYGQRGIITKKLSGINEEIALSILSNGKDYSDNLNETSLEYDYPNTSVKGRDESEISGMIGAMNYSVPIFVILGNKLDGPKRRVLIGLVKDYDNDRHKFLIDLLNKFPTYDDSGAKDIQTENEDFNPHELNENNKSQLVKIRRNQQKFRYGVLKRYGKTCSVCDFDIEDAIEAAHIIPKGSRGTDDIRNGIPMCANHHKLFDANYFAFDENTRVIFRNNIDAKILGITRSDLKHMKRSPHTEALAERRRIFIHSL